MALPDNWTRWDVLFELNTPLGNEQVAIRETDTVYIEAIGRRVFQLNRDTKTLEYKCEACHYDELDNCYFTIEQVNGRHWIALPTVLHLNCPEELWFKCSLLEEVRKDTTEAKTRDLVLRKFLHLLYFGEEFKPPHKRKATNKKPEPKLKEKVQATPPQPQATSAEKRKRTQTKLPAGMQPTPEKLSDLVEEVEDLTAEEAGGSDPKEPDARVLYISFARDKFAITKEEPRREDDQIRYVRELTILLRLLYDSREQWTAELEPFLCVLGISVRNPQTNEVIDELSVRDAISVMGRFYSIDTPPPSEDEHGGGGGGGGGGEQPAAAAGSESEEDDEEGEQGAAGDVEAEDEAEDVVVGEEQEAAVGGEGGEVLGGEAEDDEEYVPSSEEKMTKKTRQNCHWQKNQTLLLKHMFKQQQMFKQHHHQMCQKKKKKHHYRILLKNHPPLTKLVGVIWSSLRLDGKQS